MWLQILACCQLLACQVNIASKDLSDDASVLTVEQQMTIDKFKALGAEINYLKKFPGEAGERVLYLDANASTAIHDKHLALLRHLPKLELLDLHGTRITDAGLKHLKTMPSLETLNLSFTKTTDCGLAHLSTLQSLSFLYLDGTRITDAGLKHLAKLKGVQNMSLSETKVTSAGAAMLAKALPSIDHDVTKLTLYVDHGERIHRLKERSKWIGTVHFLGGGVIDDKDLAQVAHIPDLETLIVADSLVSDQGLATLSKLSALQYLDIGSSHVRGPGLQHLHGLTHLKSLHISGNRIAVEYIESLELKLPKCRIHR
ncbi:leucine-rich repeat domain-containing protein [Fuerstiella marisgermanici]|uniref:Ran GTPase-activating protein (RanGAP) involved in mRNA processing and transport n=1 Tax=Fuerstiella marisgermanici TaxID=1891926 RepID=A0A1P8WBV7_9PLAN|nr:hypothetical protein [Fuerstiella marisgermanici]APZ91526.1 Ran GTPase-activating protein (RanGAP) involved in mRNA processing and transport [Fuerstiella marisgermanici]